MKTKENNYCIHFLLIVSFLFLASFSKIYSQSSKNSIHVALGIPTDSDSSDDYLIYRPQYVLSYNHNRNVANWVSWELNKSYYGSTGRYNGRFITDTSLPEDFYRVTHNDYSNSGYDRGHMVRSEERTKTKADNKATFLLTNILPQKPDLNRGIWLKLEMYCEKLCKIANKELFVIAGGIYHSDEMIDELIAIPDSCFKIIVILEKGQKVKDITQNTEVIAVVMPNEQGVRNTKWEDYTTTIRRIENSTGYDFLSKLTKKLQDILEMKKWKPQE